jgi:hypothetical protein
MEVSNDEFWRRLLGAVGGADEAEREAHADAERLLAEGEPAPLSEAQIEAMVRQAIAPDETTVRQAGGPGAAAAGPELDVAPPSGGPPRRFGLRRVLAAALALVMTPGFVAAATVGAAVYATSLVLRNTTKMLSYQEAIRIMLNEGQTDASRDAAQGAVYLKLVDVVDVLRTVSREHPALADQAGLLLSNVRAVLDAPEAFVLRHYPAALDDLEVTVLDPGCSVVERRAALGQIAELVDFGIAALLEMGRTELAADLKRDNEVVLQQLRSMVQ